MDDLGERIQQVLGDPAQMAQIMDVARSLMGEGAESGEAPAAAPSAAGLPEKLAALLRQQGGQDDRQALLQAMKPYLSEKRRRKMERAIQLTRMAHLAKLAMEGMGGGEDA